MVPPELQRSFAAFWFFFQMPHEIPYFGRGRKMTDEKALKKQKLIKSLSTS